MTTDCQVQAMGRRPPRTARSRGRSPARRASQTVGVNAGRRDSGNTRARPRCGRLGEVVDLLQMGGPRRDAVIRTTATRNPLRGSGSDPIAARRLLLVRLAARELANSSASACETRWLAPHSFTLRERKWPRPDGELEQQVVEFVLAPSRSPRRRRDEDPGAATGDAAKSPLWSR